MKTIDDRQTEDLTNLEPMITVIPSTSERGGARALPPDPQKQVKKIAWIAFVFSILSLFFAGTGFWFLYQIMEEKQNAEENSTPDISLTLPDEGDYIEYQGKSIPVLEDVPVNGYDTRGFYYDENDYIRYEVDGKEALVGIDVSIYQQTIDWAQVAEAGVDFAMIRVARRGYGEEGNLGMDVHYVENIVGATQHGIDVGVYFFSQATSIWEVDEEITLLLSLIHSYDITYPVVFDWEFISTSDWARTDYVTGEEITAMAKYFCEKVESAGYTPAVYFNMDMGYRYLDLSELTDYTFWLSELNPVPRFYYHFDMWQYSFTGTVPGIQGYVDLNLSFRDFAKENP